MASVAHCLLNLPLTVTYCLATSAHCWLALEHPLLTRECLPVTVTHLQVVVAVAHLAVTENCLSGVLHLEHIRGFEVGSLGAEDARISFEVGLAYSAEGMAGLEGSMALAEVDAAKLGVGTAQFVTGMTKLEVGTRRRVVGMVMVMLLVGMVGLAVGTASLVVGKAHLAVGMARMPSDCRCHHYCLLGRGSSHVKRAVGLSRS